MPTGFQVFNEAGNVQIDADYKNMVFVRKGTYSLPAGQRNGPLPSIQVQVTGTRPIIALTCEGSRVLCNAPTIVGDTYNFTITNLGNLTTENIPETPVSGEYFIFDMSDTVSAGNSGLQIFNAAGQLVFDSNKQYMKVLDFFAHTGTTFDAVTRSYSGKKAAVVSCEYGYTYVVQNSPSDPTDPNWKLVQNQVQGVSTNGSAVTTQKVVTYTNARQSASSAGQARSELPSLWMVLDVTNL